METWKAVLLGVLQGLTEFLPVSSSGHLRAAREVLGFGGSGDLGDVGPLFDVFLHVATLFTVLIYFRKDIVGVFLSEKRWAIILCIAVATVPIFAIGYLFGSAVEASSPWVVVFGWGCSAIYLFVTRGRDGERDYTDLGWGRTLALGCAQAFAILPGVSRSGSTIAAGILLGMKRTAAARLSFLLAIPAIGGAGAYKTLKLIQDGQGLAVSEFVWPLVYGMIAAFLVGMVAIHVLLRLVKSDTFYHFAWYNLAAAALFAAYLLWA